MKTILNVVGARPNFIKIAPIMKEMKCSENIRPILVHTGQHYDILMSQLFFKELQIPLPDINLEVGSGSHAVQTAEIMIRLEKVLLEFQPDIVVVVGDVNSTIASALTAVKLGFSVAHVEAGLRSFDRSMPEEINRIVTDSISDFLFVPEHSGVTNLKSEGIPDDRIHFVGNVMIDTLINARKRAEMSDVLSTLQLEARGYATLTLHRPSNVDDVTTFSRIVDALFEMQHDLPIVFPIHPRTLKNIQRFGLEERLNNASNLRIVKPLGYLDFIKLLDNAKMVITDSGGIQEEAMMLGVPCITLRETTEWPATVEAGANVLAGTNRQNILCEFRKVLNGSSFDGNLPELWDGRAASRITRILERV